MTIVEFLTARLDAEEAVAQDLLSQEYPLEYRHQGMHANIWSNSDYSEEGISSAPSGCWLMWQLSGGSSRWRMRSQAWTCGSTASGGVGARDLIVEPYAGDVLLRALAAPYADHPDFDPSWGQQ